MVQLAAPYIQIFYLSESTEKRASTFFWVLETIFLGMVHPNFDPKSVNFSYKRWVDWFWLMCVSIKKENGIICIHVKPCVVAKPRNKSDFNLLIFWGELQESLGKTRVQYNNADIANFQLCLVQLWKRQTFLPCFFYNMFKKQFFDDALDFTSFTLKR